MGIDRYEVAELIWSKEPKGETRFWVAPIVSLPSDVVVPPSWSELLTSKIAHREIGRVLWKDVRDSLPNVVKAIEDATQGVVLVQTGTALPALLYLFSADGELYARQGNLPLEQLPPVGERLGISLRPVYKIHDGWVNFFGADGGLLPIEQWQTLGADEGNERDGFLEVFSSGGNALGFDLSENPPGAYVIWSDGDVEPVENFWVQVDEWISGNMTVFDRLG